MKKCQFCAEEIQDEAIKCKHCGSYLTPEIIAEKPNRTGLWITLVVIIFIIIASLSIISGKRDKSNPALIVAQFAGKVNTGDYDAARLLVHEDSRAVFFNEILEVYAQNMSNGLPHPSSLTIFGKNATERYNYLIDSNGAHYTFHLYKTFWGWKITHIE